MKKIYFVRHGETDSNKSDIASGSEDDCSITDNGRQQARETGQQLKDKNIDLVVSSSMKRTVETAQIIAKEIGYDPKRIITSKHFVERGMGSFSGRPNSEFFELITSGQPLHEGMETNEAMHQRIHKGLQWLAKQKGENVLLVSHGGVSRIIRLIHQELPLSHMYKLEKLDNAAIYEFDLKL